MYAHVRYVNYKGMSTSFKAVVFAHHKKADGTYNVKVRVTHNRVRRQLPTNVWVRKEDLTRGFKVKSQEVLDKLKVLIDEYYSILGTLPVERSSAMSIDELLEYISNYHERQQRFELDFIAFGRQCVKDTLAEGREGSAKGYDTALNALERFLHTDHLPIEQLTSKLLADFKSFIEHEPVQNYKPKKGKQIPQKGGRATSLYLGYLRVLHNKAKDKYNDEEAGIIRIPNSPFKKTKVPKQPKTRKRSIKLEQLQAIMQVADGKTKDSRQTLARDMFLLSFGLIGMNSVDLYRCNEYKDGRISYKRSKTKSRREDEAEISIKVEPCVLPLVEHYRDRTGKRVFNFHQRYSSHMTFNTAINKGLKLIEKMEGIKEDDLEFYAARHTWATLARNKASIDKETIHEALNHVDDNMRVTDIYIDRDYSQQDAANKQVLELVQFRSPSTYLKTPKACK